MENSKQNIETLETVRNIRMRKNPKTGKIEVLLLIRPNGRYEFPGGKVFDSVEEFREFKELSIEKAYSKKEKELRKETLEEIKQNIDDEKLYFLGKHVHKFDNGNYKFDEKDEIEFKNRAITYFISLQKDPNAEIDLSNSDDGHVRHEWMELVYLEEIIKNKEDQDAFFRGKEPEFNRNSDITKLSKSVSNRVRAVLRRIEGAESREFMDEIIEKGYIESDVYKNKVKKNGKIVEEGEQINMFDFNRFDLLSGPQRKKLFEKYWGKLEPSYKCVEGVDGYKESRKNNKEILENFNWKLDKALGYIENHVGLSFPSELSQKIPLKNTEDIISFLNRFGKPEWRERLAQLFKVARTYLHFKERAPYAFDGEKGLPEHAKGFGGNFRGIFEKKGKKFVLNSVGKGKKEIKLESITAANEKAEYRVIDKLMTKPDLEFDNVKDIFRARVVCDKEDFVDVARTLKSKYKSQGITLKDKGKTKNKNRGMVGVQYLVGEYPIIEVINGKEKEFMVPFEIQIIDPKELSSSNSGTKHHDVYTDGNNLGARNTKVFGGTDKKIIEEKVEKHAKNPLIQNAKNIKLSGKKLGRKMVNGHFNSKRVLDKSKEEIRETFNKKGFYTLDDKYIAYQEVLKNWGKPTRNEKWENRMIAVLNKRVGLSLKKDEWTKFFLNPAKFVDETIYELESKNRSKEEKEKRVNRFKTVVSTLPGMPKFETKNIENLEVEYEEVKN